VYGKEPADLQTEGVVRSESSTWVFGSDLDGGIDVNGDSIPDLLVSATGAYNTAGAAWLISGSDLPTEGEEVQLFDVAISEVQGVDSEDFAGSSVAFVGDINGDGIIDSAVGAPFADGSKMLNSGLVGIWSGVPDGNITGADITIEGYYSEAGIGSVIGPSGDQNDDGYDDFMLSFGTGEIVQVVPGGTQPEISTETGPITRVYSENGVESHIPQMIGDVDSDGHTDLAVTFNNKFFCIYTSLALNPTNTDEAPHFSTPIDGDDSYIFSMTDLGDIDHDGLDDTFIGANYYEPSGSAEGIILLGSHITPGGTIPFSKFELRAHSQRTDSKFGYRAAVVDYQPETGERALILGGPNDIQAGKDAGAVAWIPVPH